MEMLPEAPRDGILSAYHACGFYPFDERDWNAWGRVRAVMYSATPPRTMR